MNNSIDKSISKTWGDSSLIHPQLNKSKELIYNPCKFVCLEPIREAESQEYGAYIFKLNSINVRFRVAKITPTKIGQFVTLWKRIGNGPILPYGIEDAVDLFIIVTCKGDNLGQFVFPKSVLYKYDIVSNNNEGGKRAMRVYPPWDIAINKQAQNTQTWQLEYFLEIPKNKPINLARAKMLYGINH